LVFKNFEENKKKQEINCVIVEDAELKIFVKIIRKYTRFFRKKSNNIHFRHEFKDKDNISKKNTQPPIITIVPGMSIKDKIKIFSGELIRRQLENKILPGRLKIPEIFLKGEKEAKDKKEKEQKEKGKGKGKDKK
jgi:hypothetical protein